MTSRIKRLPEELIRQIAAGEVVERPASVVKELVENSLDAGARRIEISIEGGGRTRVKVRDDGCGMTREEAALAFERHATSKISSAEDLQRIASFGFRGEALPSIASVARVRMLTTPRGGKEGTEIVIEGSASPAVRPAAAREGTEIEVSDLFFNTPARLKFMRAPQTETRRAADVVARQALAHPGVAFTLRTEKKTLLDCPAVDSLSERVEAALGRDFFSSLIPVSAREGMVGVEGFVTGPQSPRPSRDDMYFFVNRRPVQDKLLVGALLRAMPRLPSGAYPGAVLFIEIPSESVDVNVHPAKTEVRFGDSSAVFMALRIAVERALGGGRAFTTVPGNAEFGIRNSEYSGEKPGAFAIPRSAPQIPSNLADGGPYASFRANPSASSIPHSAFHIPHSEEVAEPLAQYAGTYIIARDSQGILFVDQHTAHERVLYERLLRGVEAGNLARQALLFPLLVELPPGQTQPDLAPLIRAGFEAETFGARTLRVTAVPALAANADMEKLVRDVLFLLDDSRAPAFDKALATMACRAAVVKNTPLTTEKMREILRDLAKTENPSVCPHGRAVARRYRLDEIERDFGRR